MEPINLAREKGYDIWGETCTQYLFVDETALDQPDFEGGKYVYTPPPRAPHNQEALWNALAKDVLSAVSTDHCPFNWPEQKGLGRDDFSKIPNGGPGIENRLHMLWNFGVRAGRPLERQLQPLRGHRGRRRARARDRARHRGRRGRPARRTAWPRSLPPP